MSPEERRSRRAVYPERSRGASRRKQIVKNGFETAWIAPPESARSAYWFEKELTKLLEPFVGQLEEARREREAQDKVWQIRLKGWRDDLQCAETANQELRRWLPISEAPRTGEHILVTSLTDSWGTCGGKKQRPHAIVHWFDDAFYLSLGNQDEPQNWPTHFKSLDDSAALLGPQHGQKESE
jgi:hypothetical protein